MDDTFYVISVVSSENPDKSYPHTGWDNKRMEFSTLAEVREYLESTNTLFPNDKTFWIAPNIFRYQAGSMWWNYTIYECRRQAPHEWTAFSGEIVNENLRTELESLREQLNRVLEVL